MDKLMTKAAKRRHIRSGGCDVYEHGCLYCKTGGENDDVVDVVKYGDFSPIEGGDIEQEVKCTICGRKWIDVFRLVDVHEIASGSESLVVVKR